jgi:NADP-dependent 3-hydroxy acid dehydrogenase YdfG
MAKTATVWGAGGGIGRALVSNLKEEGWRVLAMGRHVSELDDLTSYSFEADVGQPGSVEQDLAAASQETDQVDL